MNRLAPALKEYMKSNFWSFANHDGVVLDPQTLCLILRPWDTTTAVAEIHYRGASFKTYFEAPFMISKMTERRALYFAERAMIFWLQKINDLAGHIVAVIGIRMRAAKSRLTFLRIDDANRIHFSAKTL
jgi:hypothetical protein